MDKWGKTLIATAIIGVFAGSIGMANIFKNDSQNVAAWVQAFGSIGAIFGSFWMIRWQNHMDEKNRQKIAKEEEVSYQKKAYLLCVISFEIFKVPVNIVKANNMVGHDKAMLKSLSETIADAASRVEKIDISKLGEEATYAFEVFRICLQTCIIHLESCSTPSSSSFPHEYILGHVSDSFDRATSALETLKS